MIKNSLEWEFEALPEPLREFLGDIAHSENAEEIPAGAACAQYLMSDEVGAEHFHLGHIREQDTLESDPDHPFKQDFIISVIPVDENKKKVHLLYHPELTKIYNDRENYELTVSSIDEDWMYDVIHQLSDEEGLFSFTQTDGGLTASD